MSNAKFLSFSALAVMLTLSAGIARAQEAAPAAPAADAPAAPAAKPMHHHHHMMAKKAKAVKPTGTDDLNAKSLEAAKANQSFTPPK